ncbi:MAG: DUF5615 family PIN-like protein [Thaumarchaeota archaeon]|nr:DUF5615 family PIN-like protein [Nitrososphaerota archaeon]
MKHKYLLDECAHVKSGALINSRFVKSQEVVGEGATDEEVFKYAKKQGLIVITRDWRFAHNMALENHPVIFMDEDKIYQLKARPVNNIPPFGDSRAFYMIEHDEIIRP